MIVKGDVVRRNMCGVVMDLQVSDVLNGLITCAGGWTFDAKTGNEIDEDLGWNNQRTGSYISLEKINVDSN